MTEMTINQLPSKTWHWLHVNETKLPWDEEQTTELPQETVTAETTDVARFCIQGTDAYNRKQLAITAPADRQITVFMDYETAGNLAVQTNLTVEENAQIRLIQLQHTQEASLVYNKITGTCAKNARVELIQIYLGNGDIYSDTTIDLNGDGSSFQSDIGYIGQHAHIIDMNEVVNHFGKYTESEINVTGALRDCAKKIFRGTIDFKTGSSDSVGNEQETVLMLGDDVENKTVPIILCSEENVVGNHGATIGELDADTLFYFASRGIDKERAETIMARAGIERLKGRIQDLHVSKEDTQAFSTMIDEALGEV